MSTHLDYPPVEPVSAALHGRRPRCGNGKLFAGFLDLQPSCDASGLDFDFVDSGDGPSVFVALIGGAIVVGFALWTEVNYEPPMWVDMVIFLPLTLVVCLGIHRPLRALLIGLQYRHKAEQGRLAPSIRPGH